jgi:molybdenum cofactor biosynthesis protein B
MSSPHREHRASGPQHVKAAVVTASDTRTPATDSSGAYLASALEERGHGVVLREIVRDETALVTAAIEKARAAGAQVVLVTGGTGISRRDTTVEAVRSILLRELPGFGELFRALSFQEIGSAAMLSRATAGITAEGLLVFALPGSTGACRTALEKLIAPELAHLVREAQR